MIKFRHLRIDNTNLHQWQDQLNQLEWLFSYPFGDDQFKIDHGENYLAFFERYGQLHYYGVTMGNQLVAVGAAVKHKRLKAWYLGDLKVHPDFRGRDLTKKIFLRHFFPCYFKCQRGFALTMMNENGSQNKVIKIMERLPLTPLKLGTILNFYLEGPEVASEYLKLKGPGFSFISLAGKKDLIMQKTGKALPLLHLEKKDGGSLPLKDHVHMWCCPEGHSLAEKLNLKPSARGFIYHHGMGKQDWSLLQTSEL